MWQRLKVNGADQGQLVAINPPAVNNPVTVVSGASIACNTGLVSPLSTAVVTIPAGGQVEAWFEHVIGGAQGANDADNPIAASHKGPIIVYLAKVIILSSSQMSSANSIERSIMLQPQEITTTINGLKSRKKDSTQGNGALIV
jgi:hypothetical protein